MLKNLASSLGINRMVMALSFARMGDAIGNSILIIIVPLYVAKLPAPWFPFPESVRVGVLLALYGIFAAILQPVIGLISDRIHRRKILIVIGLIVMAAATLGYVVVSQFVDLVGLRILQGLGAAMTIPTSLAIISVASQKHTRGGSMGVYSTMRMVGFALGPLIGGYIYDHYNFNIVFIVGAVFVAIGVVLVQLWVKEMPPKKEATAEKKTKFRIFDPALLSAGIVGAALATFVMASDFSMISTLETQFNSILNQGAFGFGLAFSALIISRLIFQVPLGRLSDHWGRKPLIIGGLILIAPATALLGYVSTTLQFTSLRVFQGIASAAIAAPAFALASDVAHAGGEGRQLSIVTMGFALGVAVGPLLTGALAVRSFTLPFLLAAGVSLGVAIVVFQFVPETVERGGTKKKKLETQSHPVEGD